MAWYDGGKAPEWKHLTSQPYSIEALLDKKDVLFKELSDQPELQGWLKQHSERVVEDVLRLCLCQPHPDEPYERKYVLPTKALEFMTHHAVFSSLAWDADLIKKYAH